MDPLQISPIPAFTDNYLWLLQRGRNAAIVDPGDAAPVLQALAAQQLSLCAILVTHHHADHIGGLAALHEKFPGAPVYGPAAESRTIHGLTSLLREGDRVQVPELGLELEAWEVPGHTLGHIAYVAPGFVLCGDTLFSAGCGRLFEGTPAQMHASLSRLATLPPETRVYCTHEYTLSNLAFARAVEPGNPVLAAESERVMRLRQQGKPSLPSSIGHERKINPFLRLTDSSVLAAAQQQAGETLSSEIKVFAALRRWKDGFRAPAA
jgi:hydroxyacylglutathione hydrolase